MRVFSVYQKIIKKNLPMILIYIIVYAVLSIMLTVISTNNSNTDFQQTKPQIAFYDYDNTELTQNFKKEIEKVAEIQEIEDNSNQLKDAIFFRKVKAIVRIEQGFTKELLAGKEVKVQVNTLPNTYDSTYVESTINNYINTAMFYINNVNLSEEQLIENINKDLSKTAEVNLIQKEAPSELKSTVTYFNYLSYVLFVTIILGVSTTMSVIHEKKIKRRILCSPLSNKRLNLELTFGHFAYSFILLVVTIGLWAILRPGSFQTPNSWLLIVNSVCVMLAILSISFLIGMLIKSKGAQTAAANVLSLGVSFISGVFVPQELLSESVLKIASFTPIYWYVTANQKIQELTSFHFEDLKPILICMSIELGFAITIWLVALVVSKNRRTSEQ